MIRDPYNNGITDGREVNLEKFYHRDKPIVCPECLYIKSQCICKKNKELAKTDEQDFIETLKTLKGWEWDLVAKHIPFSLCLERVNKEIIRLQEFECSVKCAVKESEG